MNNKHTIALLEDELLRLEDELALAEDTGDFEDANEILLQMDEIEREIADLQETIEY